MKSKKMIGVIFKTEGFSQFNFVSKPGLRLSLGDIVEFYSDNFRQLGRISSIESSNPLINENGAVNLTTIFENDDIEREAIIGDFEDYLVCKVEVIGRRNPNLKNSIFVRKKVPPKLGSKVFLVAPSFLEEQLSFNDETCIKIGNFIQNEEISIFVNVEKIISMHFAILAMTGAGKSWTVATIIERLKEAIPDFPIIIFDPHSEYSTLKIPENPKDSYFSSSVKIFTTGNSQVINIIDENFKKKYDFDRNSVRIATRVREMEYYQISYLLNTLYGLSEAQTRILQDVWGDFKIENKGRDFQVLEDFTKVCNNSDVSTKTAKKTLIQKFKLLITHTPFLQKEVNDKVLDYKEIVKKGQISIMDLSNLSNVYQQAFVAMITEKILNERIFRKLPPALCIFEEAHRFIPGSAESSASKPALKRLAQEGRKFLMGMGVVSQRPSRLDSDVLSQCNTQIVMRLTNPDDQRYVKGISEYISDSDLIQIRSLSPGEAFIFGPSVLLSLPTKIRSDRLSKHGGITPNLEKELDNFSP
ncbi:MAG: ATP-binding protein [Candidatus Lokiarchaeota archaeon]|nr:ATP-binding protein [Candidatus Harpocratesius repetitus]